MLNLPNILTLLRIVAIPLIVALIIINSMESLAISCLVYIGCCLTDYFDGYLARKQNLQSDFGRILDPIADKLLVSSILVTLSWCHILTKSTVIAAILILGREILISGLRDYLSTKKITLPSSKLAKWKTCIQMIALGFLIVGGTSTSDHTTYIKYIHDSGIALLWIAVILTLITGWQYLQKILDS